MEEGGGKATSEASRCKKSQETERESLLPVFLGLKCKPEKDAQSCRAHAPVETNVMSCQDHISKHNIMNVC